MFLFSQPFRSDSVSDMSNCVSEFLLSMPKMEQTLEAPTDSSIAIKTINNVPEVSSQTSEGISSKVYSKVYMPWQFKPGMPGGPGRPKGVKNAATALMRAAPKLAQHYIKRAAKSDAICVDARKWILPVEEDKEFGDKSYVQIVFAGDSLRSVAEDELNPRIPDVDKSAFIAQSSTISVPESSAASEKSYLHSVKSKSG